MNQNKNILVLFTEKAETVFSSTLKQYNLEETDEELTERISKNTPSKAVITKKLIRIFVLEKISNKEFLEKLHAGLGTDKETTKNIALDIINNLIPLLEKIPEDKLGEYNQREKLEERAINQEIENKEVSEKDKKEAFAKAREELMRKISTKHEANNIKQEVGTPGAVKPEIVDVEENAKTIEHIQERPQESPAIEEAEEKKADPYKETID